MPTYAGYLMTPEAQREWLRKNDPKKPENPRTSAMHLVLDRMRKAKLVGKFDPHIVALPFQDPNIPPEERVCFILARRVCLQNQPIWLPPRAEPGVDDIRAREVLKKCGINVSDWVVFFHPRGDPFDSSFVNAPS